jgi:hypothetical protein
VVVKVGGEEEADAEAFEVGDDAAVAGARREFAGEQEAAAAEVKGNGFDERDKAWVDDESHLLVVGCEARDGGVGLAGGGEFEADGDVLDERSGLGIAGAGVVDMLDFEAEEFRKARASQAGDHFLFSHGRAGRAEGMHP